MDNVIEKAKSRMRELESEMNELRAFIRTYEKLSGESVTEVVPAMMVPSMPAAYGGDVVLKKSEMKDVFSTKEEIVACAREVLKKAYPQPMLIGDLYEAVVSMGIRVSGNNPKGNFSAKLSPPKDLEFVQGEGWYFRPEKVRASGVLPKAQRFAGGGGSPLNTLSGDQRDPPNQLPDPSGQSRHWKMPGT